MENKVKLKVDKPLKIGHIDMIIMFLENQKLSGGGLINDYELDEHGQLLTVTYEEQHSMEQVIKRKNLQFHVYKFTVVDSTDNGSSDVLVDHIDNRSLILKNVPEIEDYIVKMYAESLAIEENSTNRIIEYNRSHYFKSICYIRFMDKIDFEHCTKKLRGRPTLNDRQIEIDQMIRTNTVFFQFDSPTIKPPITIETIEEFFTNKKMYETNPVMSIYKKGLFVFIQFDSTESQEAFLLDNIKEQELLGHNQSVFEKLPNEKLFDEQMDQLNTDSASMLGNTSSSVSIGTNLLDEEVLSDTQSDIMHRRFRMIRSSNENIVRRKYLRIKKLITKR